MDRKTFDVILERRIGLIKKVLAGKAKEYGPVDRLHNFKAASKIGTECTPESALLGMMKKHIVSMVDIVEGISEGSIPSQVLIDEKLGDVINYTILLESMLAERRTTLEEDV